LYCGPFASHPDQEALKKRLAEFTALEMTALASLPSASEDFRNDVRSQFAEYIAMILKQAVAGDRD
jgi:hypothetical protein